MPNGNHRDLRKLSHIVEIDPFWLDGRTPGIIYTQSGPLGAYLRVRFGDTRRALLLDTLKTVNGDIHAAAASLNARPQDIKRARDATCVEPVYDPHGLERAIELDLAHLDAGPFMTRDRYAELATLTRTCTEWAAWWRLGYHLLHQRGRGARR